jgi:hypothetical protein
MRKEFGDIYQAIVAKWAAANHHEAVKALQDAPHGAATGTEGLLMILEHLTGITQDHPELIDMVRHEMVELVVYCKGRKIIVNDTLLSHFSK